MYPILRLKTWNSGSATSLCVQRLGAHHSHFRAFRLKPPLHWQLLGDGLNWRLGKRKHLAISSAIQEAVSQGNEESEHMEQSLNRLSKDDTQESGFQPTGDVNSISLLFRSLFAKLFLSSWWLHLSLISPLLPILVHWFAQPPAWSSSCQIFRSSLFWNSLATWLPFMLWSTAVLSCLRTFRLALFLSVFFLSLIYCQGNK